MRASFFQLMAPALMLFGLLGTPGLAEDEALPSPEPAPVWDEAAPPCGCACVAPAARFWVKGEYLWWFIKDGPVPGPLITTGSLADPVPGALGQPNTVVLFGESGIDYRDNSGFRLLFGGAIDRDGTLGFELGGFMLETHTVHFEANSEDDGSPLYARPFVSALTGGQQAALITAPNAFLGGIDIFSDSRFWGGDANLVLGNLTRASNCRLDLLAGFRYLGLKDELRFSQSSTLLADGLAGFDGQVVRAPSIISIRDLFETHDQFYGGQVGLRGGYRWGRLCLGGLAEAGIGSTKQDVKITGHTALTDATGLTQLRLGGLYSQASNIGWYSRDRFSFVSEVGVRAGVDLWGGLNAHIGWSLIYWSDVARPGSQINQVLNPRNIPSSPVSGFAGPPLQPGFAFDSTDFWAQGLTAGLEWRY